MTGSTASNDFPFTAGAYDTSLGGSQDGFVAKFDPSQSGSNSLIYATYLGGTNGADTGTGIAIDSSGNAYVTGNTLANDFPTLNAYDISLGGTSDGFFTKLNADGTALIYSSYLGGANGGEYGNSIAVDSSGNGYITGWTSSNDFPTVNAYDSTLGGFQDAFAAKFDPSLSGAPSLIYSTYLGGVNGNETGLGIAVDSSGNGCLTGWTDSDDFPVTGSAYDGAFNGNTDAFITKLNSTGNGLLYSTYLGSVTSTITEWGDAIALDNADDIYITGYTQGLDFPTTIGAYDTSLGGTQDAFVAKLDPDLSGTSSLIYSTYLGGGDIERGYGIAVTATGIAAVTGYTDSSDFPLSPDAYDSTLGGSRDAFVATINADGSDLNYSTYLGGGSSDSANGVALDSSDDIYVVGYTQSGDFPTSATAYDTSLDGTRDAFVVKMTVDSGSGAMAVWRQNLSTTPEYSRWNGSSFSAEANSANVGEWRIIAGAEAPTRDEIIVVGVVDTTGVLNGEMWDGSTWSALSLNPLGETAVSEDYWWGFDLAYEQQSGEAVLVWNNNTATRFLQYSTWDGALWSAKTTVAAYTGGEPQHMHMAVKPGANEMVLVVNDVNADDYALVWTGSTWQSTPLGQLGHSRVRPDRPLCGLRAAERPGPGGLR